MWSFSFPDSDAEGPAGAGAALEAKYELDWATFFAEKEQRSRPVTHFDLAAGDTESEKASDNEDADPDQS